MAALWSVVYLASEVGGVKERERGGVRGEERGRREVRRERKRKRGGEENGREGDDRKREKGKKGKG